MAANSHVAGAVATASGGVYTLTIPSGASTGDFLVVAIVCSTPDVATPTGWAPVISQTASGANIQAFSKTCASADPGSTVTFSGGGSNTGKGFVWAFQNATSIEAAVGSRTTIATTSQNGGSATTARDGEVQVEVWGFFSGGSALTPTGIPATNIKNIASTSTLPGLLASYQQVASAGAAPGETATLSGNAQWGTVTLTIFGNIPPQAPTLNTPANATQADLAAGATFTWTHNSLSTPATQTNYALRRKIGAGAYEYWNATAGTWGGSIVWNASSSASATFAASKWTDGNVYNWSVATQDAGGQGPFASDNTITASVPPTASVTAPSGSSIPTATPTVTWTETTAPGDVQTNYRIVVESGAFGLSPGSGVTAWDSGVVASSSASVVCGATLTNTTAYRVFVQITETGGEVSTWSHSDFTVSLTPPANPSISLAPGAMGIVATITGHDTGSPFSAATTQFTLERTVDGGATWVFVRGGTAITPDPTLDNATLTDYETPLNTTVTYRTRTLGISGVNIAPSAYVTASATVVSNDWQVKNPLDPTINTTVVVVEWSDSFTENAAAFALLGRKLPVVVTDGITGETVNLVLSAITAAERNALKAVMASTAVLLVQCPDGEQWYGRWPAQRSRAVLTPSLDNPALTWAVTFTETDAP